MLNPQTTAKLGLGLICSGGKGSTLQGTVIRIQKSHPLQDLSPPVLGQAKFSHCPYSLSDTVWLLFTALCERAMEQPLHPNPKACAPPPHCSPTSFSHSIKWKSGPGWGVGGWKGGGGGIQNRGGIHPWAGPALISTERREWAASEALEPVLSDTPRIISGWGLKAHYRRFWRGPEAGPACPTTPLTPRTQPATAITPPPPRIRNPFRPVCTFSATVAAINRGEL